MAGTGPHVNQWSHRLACQIVKTQFGDLCETVISSLISKGRQTLPELLRSTQLAHPLLKQVLLALLQQNCVHAYLQPEEELISGRRPAYYLYEAQLGWILQSVRLPKFLTHVAWLWGEEEGPIAEAMLLVLMEHGRLRLDQVVSAVQARLAQHQAAAEAAAVATEQAGDSEQQDGQQQRQGQQPGGPAAGAGSTAGTSEDALRHIFFALVHKRYVERCPPCNLPPPAPSAHPAATKGRKGAKTGSAAIAESQADALRTLANRRYLDERFTVPADLALADSSFQPPATVATDDASQANGMEVDEPEAADAAAAPAGSSKGGAPAGGSRGSKRVRAGGALGSAGLLAGRLSKRPRRDDVLGQAIASAAAAESAAAAAAANGEGEAEDEEGAGLVVKRRKGKAAKGKLGDDEEDGEAQGEAPGAARIKTEPAKKAGQAVSRSGAAVLWRVNYEEFNRVFRHNECVKTVHEKSGMEAGTALAAMLQHSARYETQLQEGRSVPMSVHDVMKSLETMEARGLVESSWTRAELEQQLQLLAADSLGIVSDMEGGPAGMSYCVNMLPILEIARHQQLQAVVRDRFGPSGLRIFNMLIQRGQLEQKQIADLGMLPPKETRELLYRMLKAGYIALQDIPKSSERVPVRTIYTWRVDLKEANTRLADELYRAAGNVLSRYNHELAQRKELLDIVEAAREAGTLNFNWTQSQRKALLRLQKVAHTLETALLKLDDQIALFNEY